jgi:hypothetical protein
MLENMLEVRMHARCNWNIDRLLLRAYEYSLLEDRARYLEDVP